MSTKYVYMFSEGNGKQRELLGGKGANLAEMTNLGMPVPQGFTVSTEACTRYYDDNKEIAPEIVEEIFASLKKLEEISGKEFGSVTNPLLVSVRSGARASMPGMMDTILNLGLNDEVVEGFASLTGNPRFAYDSYRRFIQMFSDVVMELPKSNFEKFIDEIKERKGVKLDTELDADDMKELISKFKAFYKEQKGEDFPSDPKTQLLEAVKAVFRSWDNPRAIYYRRMNDIPSSWGTAVNVQMMVFGNMGETSGTGVAFTRNPSTGEAKLYGEFLMNAQGEDVVAGIRTPQKIDQLKEVSHEAYEQFVEICKKLENHYRDMQDMEFTIENGKLYMLQTRNGKRTAAAALQIAVDLVNEGMNAAQGILTVRGGMTSHAAVVARGMGTCCVSGCGDIVIDEHAKVFTLGGKEIHEGDYISLDGTTGNIYGEAIPTVPASISGNFGTIMGWADEFRKLQIRTNADTPRDAKQAAAFGAEGIGLCRTEHMFFEADRIKAMREMIVAKDEEQRRKALDKLLPMQRGDFEGLYEAMEGKAVTIRYLDPPLHEFLPTEEKDIIEIAGELNITVEELKNVIASLHEFNPMMGHRGCRLAVSYPEIAEMQTRAVIEAAINVSNRHPDWTIVPEIMIPLVGEVKELAYVKGIVTKTAAEIIANSGIDMHYKVGTMIEIPRAAVTADEIAKEAEFFSFGTNDLTQMTFGFSRDDAGKFLNYYYDKKIYEQDPFARLDQKGVGKLVEMAARLGRETRPDIKLGICGEHGGDPSSIEFCHRTGLTYVSCSPFRVPIARLAAAQAAIKFPRD